jgi:hypothetical protein
MMKFFTAWIWKTIWLNEEEKTEEEKTFDK